MTRRQRTNNKHNTNLKQDEDLNRKLPQGIVLRKSDQFIKLNCVRKGRVESMIFFLEMYLSRVIIPLILYLVN